MKLLPTVYDLRACKKAVEFLLLIVHYKQPTNLIITSTNKQVYLQYKKTNAT